MTTIKETIIDLFDLEKMPPEKIAEMVERLGRLVFQAVLVRLLPLLSESDMTAYEKIVAKKEPDAIFKFLGDKFPDFQNVVMEESEILRAQLSGEFKAAGV